MSPSAGGCLPCPSTACSHSPSSRIGFWSTQPSKSALDLKIDVGPTETCEQSEDQRIFYTQKAKNRPLVSEVNSKLRLVQLYLVSTSHTAPKPLHIILCSSPPRLKPNQPPKKNSQQHLPLYIPHADTFPSEYPARTAAHAACR